MSPAKARKRPLEAALEALATLAAGDPLLARVRAAAAGRAVLAGIVSRALDRSGT